ncbi:hypothetical protein CHL67_02035 [Prosthecochloris sp. GSB1]|nr:hypothetical protein CHL67_02035 [Prosthecochloris sp. GSB1]
MLKFLLLLVAVFLVARMLFRFFFRNVFFPWNGRRFRDGVDSSSSRAEETDYEVIETHIKDRDA